MAGVDPAKLLIATELLEHLEKGANNAVLE
jgi:hypothetical protein